MYKNIYPSFSNIVYPSFLCGHCLNFYASRSYLIFSRVFLCPNKDVKIQGSKEVGENTNTIITEQNFWKYLLKAIVYK